MSATDLLNNVQSWMEYFRIRMEMETRCSGSNLLKLAEALDAQFVLGLGQPPQRGSVDDVPPLIIIEKSVDDPKMDAPQAEAPKMDDPKMDDPKMDDPQMDAPQIEEPKTDDQPVPVLEIPTLEIPALEIVKELTCAEQQPVQA